MTDRSNMEIAERGARRRARVLTASAVLFIAMQGTHYGSFNGGRAVDQVKISAWLVWALALLVVLATGGGFFKNREVRQLMNDESTRAHRANAFSWGFWAAMAAAVLLYGLTMIEPATSARDAIHLMLTFGVLLQQQSAIEIATPPGSSPLERREDPSSPDALLPQPSSVPDQPSDRNDPDNGFAFVSNQAQIESLSSSDTVAVWNDPGNNSTVIWIGNDMSEEMP